MALIIEDGSLVADADSYASAADLLTFAHNRGMDVPTNVVDREHLLMAAMDYLDQYSTKWQGERVSASQSLSWPRTDAYLDGSEIGYSEIPRNLFYAQLALAVEAQTTNLLPNRYPSDKGRVVREKIDGVGEFQYSDQPGDAVTVPMFPRVQSLITPLMAKGGFGLIINRA